MPQFRCAQNRHYASSIDALFSISIDLSKINPYSSRSWRLKFLMGPQQCVNFHFTYRLHSCHVVQKVPSCRSRFSIIRFQTLSGKFRRIPLTHPQFTLAVYAALDNSVSFNYLRRTLTGFSTPSSSISEIQSKDLMS